MISTDILNRFPPFKAISEEALRAVALAAETVTSAPGDVLFECNQPASAFYLLMGGTLELWIVSVDRNGNAYSNFYPAGEVRAGEVVGISALISPYVYTATAQATKASTLLRFDARALRQLAEEDARLDSALMHMVAQATMSRLHDARSQLAVYHRADHTNGSMVRTEEARR